MFNESLPTLMRRFVSGASEPVSGFVAVGMTITDGGQVQETWLVDSDIVDQDFVNGVLDGVREANLGEKSGGGAEVEFTFRFVNGVPFRAGG